MISNQAQEQLMRNFDSPIQQNFERNGSTGNVPPELLNDSNFIRQQQYLQQQQYMKQQQLMQQQQQYMNTPHGFNNKGMGSGFNKGHFKGANELDLSSDEELLDEIVPRRKPTETEALAEFLRRTGPEEPPANNQQKKKKNSIFSFKKQSKKDKTKKNNNNNNDMTNRPKHVPLIAENDGKGLYSPNNPNNGSNSNGMAMGGMNVASMNMNMNINNMNNMNNINNMNMNNININPLSPEENRIMVESPEEARLMQSLQVKRQPQPIPGQNQNRPRRKTDSKILEESLKTSNQMKQYMKQIQQIEAEKQKKMNMNMMEYPSEFQQNAQKKSFVQTQSVFLQQQQLDDDEFDFPQVPMPNHQRSSFLSNSHPIGMSSISSSMSNSIDDSLGSINNMSPILGNTSPILNGLNGEERKRNSRHPPRSSSMVISQLLINQQGLEPYEVQQRMDELAFGITEDGEILSDYEEDNILEDEDFFSDDDEDYFSEEDSEVIRNTRHNAEMRPENCSFINDPIPKAHTNKTVQFSEEVGEISDSDYYYEESDYDNDAYDDDDDGYDDDEEEEEKINLQPRPQQKIQLHVQNEDMMLIIATMKDVPSISALQSLPPQTVDASTSTTTTTTTTSTITTSTSTSTISLPSKPSPPPTTLPPAPPTEQKVTPSLTQSQSSSHPQPETQTPTLTQIQSPSKPPSPQSQSQSSTQTQTQTQSSSQTQEKEVVTGLNGQKHIVHKSKLKDEDSNDETKSANNIISLPPPEMSTLEITSEDAELEEASRELEQLEIEELEKQSKQPQPLPTSPQERSDRRRSNAPSSGRNSSSSRNVDRNGSGSNRGMKDQSQRPISLSVNMKNVPSYHKNHPQENEGQQPPRSYPPNQSRPRPRRRHVQIQTRKPHLHHTGVQTDPEATKEYEALVEELSAASTEKNATIESLQEEVSRYHISSQKLSNELKLAQERYQKTAEERDALAEKNKELIKTGEEKQAQFDNLSAQAYTKIQDLVLSQQKLLRERHAMENEIMKLREELKKAKNFINQTYSSPSIGSSAVQGTMGSQIPSKPINLQQKKSSISSTISSTSLLMEGGGEGSLSRKQQKQQQQQQQLQQMQMQQMKMQQQQQQQQQIQMQQMQQMKMQQKQQQQQIQMQQMQQMKKQQQQKQQQMKMNSSYSQHNPDKNSILQNMTPPLSATSSPGVYAQRVKNNDSPLTSHNIMSPTTRIASPSSAKSVQVVQGIQGIQPMEVEISNTSNESV